MSSSIPYRASVRARDAFAPALGWTRRAALGLAVLGAAPSVRTVYDLLADRDCDKQPTPHFALAALVVAVALGLGLAGVKAQRWVARAIARRARVRSALGGAAFASLAVLPALVLALLSACAAAVVDVGVTLHLCFDVTRAFFPIGC